MRGTLPAELAEELRKSFEELSYHDQTHLTSVIKPVVKPVALRPGDTIGIAAPASAFDPEAFRRGVERLKGLGYGVRFRDDIVARNGYLAGSDGKRVAEIEELFADPGVRAVFCARGGYGSQRLLPLLDSSLIRRHPKLFVGYSDITALHCYFNGVCGMATVHGPFLNEIADLDTAALEYLFKSLSRTDPWGESPAAGLEVLKGGQGAGALTGGSLTVFSMTLGTPYEADTAGRILFFEDRGEKPYAIDRLFSHLNLAGKFIHARGLILGKFIPPAGWTWGEESYRGEIRRIVLDATRPYRFPVVLNFPAGHCNGNVAIPFGVRVLLDGEGGRVVVEEACLSESGGRDTQ
ncbi:MAG: LD-carboxypeptidase [Candidatus Aureabacteria bacterium]|nr:LD-carboxypeptidase [Candidatus Auribacterota bacterium]